jgi:signal transduction histidine kinase
METRPYIKMNPAKDEESVLFWPLIHDLECSAILKLCDFGESRRFTIDDLQYVRPIANAVANLLDLFTLIDFQAEQVQTYDTLLAEAQEQIQKLQLGERLSYQFLTATSHLHELAGLLGGMSSDREEFVAVVHASSISRADKERLISVVDRFSKHRKDALDKIRQMMRDRPERDTSFKRLANVKDIINEQLDIYESQMENEGIRSRKSLKMADVLIEVDPSVVRYVVRILMNNAIRAVNDGPNRPKRIDFFASRGQKNLNLRLKDNGIGIPKEIQRRIFEAFFTTRKDGSGIGLYWAKRAIEEEHGGKLWLDRSLPNEGSTFVISLPLQ